MFRRGQKTAGIGNGLQAFELVQLEIRETFPVMLCRLGIVVVQNGISTAQVLEKLSSTLGKVATNEGFIKVAASMSAPIDFIDSAGSTAEMHKQLENNLAVMKAAGIEPQ